MKKLPVNPQANEVSRQLPKQCLKLGPRGHQGASGGYRNKAKSAFARPARVASLTLRLCKVLPRASQDLTWKQRGRIVASRLIKREAQLPLHMEG